MCSKNLPACMSRIRGLPEVASVLSLTLDVQQELASNSRGARRHADSFSLLLSLSVMSCSTKLQGHMTVSTENATPPKSTKSRDSNASVQIQIKPQSRFEFVPRNSEESKFLNLVDFGGRSIFSGKWHKHTDEARNHVGLGLNLSHMRHVSYVVRFSIEKLHTDI